MTTAPDRHAGRERTARTRVALLFTALLLALTGGGSAEVRYVAFGDSITRGNDCHVTATGPPDSIFDGDGPGCRPSRPCEDQTQADADGCGYAWRLEDTLQSAGIDAAVINAGSGGERTPDALRRINSWIAPSDDVLLLMEGTNDVSLLIKDDPAAILPSAIKANLRTMIDKATAKGLDTAVATVIERVCPSGFPRNCPGPTPQANPNETWTNSLNNKIRDLAAEQDRARLEPDDELCNTQGCVDRNYYRPDIKFGHLDADGYDVLAPLFDTVITADPTLASPTPTAPAGDAVPEPVFTWNKRSGARLYHLRVQTSGGSVLYDRWHDEDEVCSGSSCSTTLGFALDGGDHSWRVRANNLRGRSPWSAWRDFSVYGVPGTPVPLSPPPDVFDDTPPLRPTYTWEPASDATEYRLVVDGVDGTVVDRVYTAASACSGGTCSARPAALPGNGEYSWKVQALNPGANGPFSQTNDFLAFDRAPRQPTPLSPFPNTFKTDPTFRWSRVDGATEYDLQVDGGAIQTVTADDVCSGSVCSAQLDSDLSIGDHDWRLRGRNPIGNGAWSATVAFEVLPCTPQHLALGPADVGAGSLYRACVSVTAGDGFAVNGGESVTLHAGQTVILEDGFQVRGRLTTRVDP